MTTGVIVFPGTNCDQDVSYALESLGESVELVWHQETSLDGLDGVVLPGGFAHGDYLRPGAIARFSPIMGAVAKAAEEGMSILGICNGFQVLCEAGLLPGALVANRNRRFICKIVDVRVESTQSILTQSTEEGAVMRVPINSYEGNYVPGEGLSRPLLRYCGPDGSIDDASNPNGSTDAIAAISNPAGNVAGVMPHPERAMESFMGSTDGRTLLAGFLASLKQEPAGV